MTQVQPKSIQIGQFWKDKQAKQYIFNQIKKADLQLHSISPHYVYLTKEIQGKNKNQQTKIIKFLFALGKCYPITPPQVFVADSFITPSLKDYRNILIELIDQQWNWRVHNLTVIMQKLPIFLQRIDQLEDNCLKLQKLGQYQTSRIYEYDILKQLCEHQPFVAFEHGEDQVKMFVASVTGCHFLLFQPTAQPYFTEQKLIVPKLTEIDSMKLVFAAQIQSLSQLDHDRNCKNEYTLTFSSLQIKKMQYNKKIYKKSLKISRSSIFIQYLIKSMKHFNVEINLDVAMLKKYSLEQSLIAEVAMKQQKMKHYFNKDTLTELNNAYQKLVQFYSSINLPYQQIYVHKIFTLYNRQDVKLILGAQIISNI